MARKEVIEQENNLEELPDPEELEGALEGLDSMSE